LTTAMAVAKISAVRKDCARWEEGVFTRLTKKTIGKRMKKGATCAP
jgi:hypothetical protein